MSEPTTGTYWNQTTPPPDSGMQPAVIKSDNATPQDSRTISVPNTGGVSVKTADYTLAAADCGRLVVLNSGSAHTFTLPATPPSVGTNQWQVAVSNEGAGTLTLAVTSPTQLDGAGTSITLAPNTGLTILTDGTNYYTQRGAAAVIPVAYGIITVNVDGAGSVPSASALGTFPQCPYAGTIVGWAVTADQSGSLSLDVWKVASTAPPTSTAPAIPTSSNKLSASAPVSISSAQSAAAGSSGVSTWTTSVAAGDVFGFNLSSISTMTKFTVEIYIQKS